MEIIVGETAGFCYGVRRAVDGATKELEKSLARDPSKRVCCLGEIVHNKKVVELLTKKGMFFINNISEAKDKMILRAHGVTKDIYILAKNKKIDIKDYTCPNVLRIHKVAEEYSKKGYYIFLCGNKNHPENIGTLSYCGKNSYVIEKENDTFKALEELEKSKIKKLLVISQTTFSLEKFYIIEEIIKNELQKEIELVIKNTICRATELRQRETEKIAQLVDYMIIIGGANSSNTKKLYDIAKKRCKECTCVESATELELDEIKKYSKIGIMAGASTPQDSIEEVKNILKMYD